MLEIKGTDLIPVEFDPFAGEPHLTLPLTRQQSEVWVESQMGREASCAFNQCFVLHLRGQLSTSSLQNALDQVLARHAALRTIFDKEGSEQRILPELNVKIDCDDLSGLEASERQASIERILQRETTEPFNLAEGPLIRLRLVREAADLYRLVLTVHHLVCDGWSSAVLFSDLAAAYAADRVGLAAWLPKPMSYREYITSELARGDAANDEAYWLERLAGEPPSLDLPLDHKRQAARTHLGARETLRLDPVLREQIKAVGASRGATLFHTLLAAFETLMFRLSGQSDLVIGIPVAGQTELENGHLVAHCVATLPLRCRINADASFSQFLKHLRSSFLEAHAHSSVTFGSLISKLQIERDPSRPPLISVVFNIDKIGAPFDFGDVTLTRVETPKRFVTFDLNVNVVDSGTELLIECDYNTDLLEPDTIRRWLGHFEVLLREVVRDLEQSVACIDILGSQVRQRLAVAHEKAKQHDGELMPLHQRFEAQARRTPDAEAVVAGVSRLTYAELDRRANQLAHRLLDHGISRGALVGLCLDRNVELVTAILAILKTGCAYVPLDPAYPVDRIAFMMEDSGARVVITEQTLEHLFSTTKAKRVVLDRDLQFIAECSAANPNVAVSSDDLAYVIYTSGSTGKPKGVLVTHANVSRLFTATDHWFGFGPHDVWTLFHSYAFDFSVWELWGALLYGGCVVIVPYWVSRDPAAFRKLLVEERVTVLNQTPSAFRQLIQADLAEPPADYALREVIFGGEAVELQALKPWFERYGDRHPRLVNMYGITETTVHVTYRPISLADVEAGRGSVIGEPIPDLYIRLLDERGEPVPVGVPGEIWVGGAGVARGYLNRPELTAERFVADPFDPSGQARLYRAGDLARRLPDGDLEFLGRRDAQVKIRGFRIELGEIEAALNSHPMVRQSAVITREARPGDVRIVAYVAVNDGEDLTVSEVRRYLRASLPDYMIPSFAMTLQALPLTANGKLDRDALPDPFRSANGDEAVGEPPAPGMEQRLAEIWREALQVDKISAGDNFFNLGGHSLLAVRVAVRLHKQIGWRMDPRALFFQNLRQLAAQAEAATQPHIERDCVT